MKPYQRREAQAYPYYKLATWDPVAMTFRDGRATYTTAEEALADTADKPGRYRISAVLEPPLGRDDLAPFTVH